MWGLTKAALQERFVVRRFDYMLDQLRLPLPFQKGVFKPLKSAL